VAGTLSDPIWQVSLRSSEIGFIKSLASSLTLILCCIFRTKFHPARNCCNISGQKSLTHTQPLSLSTRIPYRAEVTDAVWWGKYPDTVVIISGVVLELRYFLFDSCTLLITVRQQVMMAVD